MDKEEMFEVFGDFDPTQYEDEVKERWGDTDAYKESARRTKRVHEGRLAARSRPSSEAAMRRVADVMRPRASRRPTRRRWTSPSAHRQQIDRAFYPCSREMHAGLGRMYVADPRFTTTYEKIGAGARAVRVRRDPGERGRESEG